MTLGPGQPRGARGRAADRVLARRTRLLIEDGSLCFVGGPGPQFNDEWSARMGLAIADHGKTRTVDEMVHQRIGDLGEFARFQALVFESTEAFVAGVDPTTFEDVIVAAPYGPALARTFSARVGGDAESRAATPSSAGSTSTPCATSARSSTPGPWWAWAA